MGRFLRITACVFVLAAAAVSPALADCMPMRQARDLIRSTQVISLVEALRAAHGSIPGEMIDGKLCDDGRGLQYILTILDPNGRVIRVTVDARSGNIVGVR
jgi:uncharacterized membrane protein YkoI